MTSTQEILAEAKKLGEMLKGHPAVEKLEKVVKELQDDTEAQRVLNDYNRFALKIQEKEEKAQPIEVDEKHKLADLHKQVVMNKVLQEFQMAQMDYSDLLRQVDSVMMNEISPATPGTPGAAGTPGSSGSSKSGSTSESGNEATGGESPIIQ